MDNKKWNEYTQTEKEAILHHWWNYFGKVVMGSGESQKIDKLIEKYTENIYEIAVNGYLNNMHGQVLIMALRTGKIEEMFKNTIKKNELSEEYKKIYESVEDEFINTVVTSYNSDNPKMSMSKEEIIDQAMALIKRGNMR